MICLVGESASGKSTIERELIKNYGMNKVVSYTTRQPRDSEIDGIDYHFITNGQFNELIRDDFFAETASYNGWQYGTAIDDLTDKDAVQVITPHGLRHFRKIGIKNIHAFYIKVDRRDRLIKILQRGDNLEESYRRSLSDVGMFSGIEDECITIENLHYEKMPEELAELIWGVVNDKKNG